VALNLWAAWIGILLGFISGAAAGMGFHRENWLGGYGSWRRRMIRLGHISFFGLAFVNLAYALTVRTMDLSEINPATPLLLIIGAIAMPTVCFLAAWRQPFRHLFLIPVTALILGVGIFIAEDLLP